MIRFDKTPYVNALKMLRQKHGKELVGLNWNRDNLFGGLDAEKATDIDGIPGLLAAIVSGGKIGEITGQEIVLEFLDHDLVWPKLGGWIIRNKERIK